MRISDWSSDVCSSDLVGGLVGIEPHRALAAADAGQQRLPFGMIMVGDLGRHPACKPLVEPELVPPRHGDEIADPLVRGPVRLDAEDRLDGRREGRASGREGGWEEGEVWVDVVVVKK